MDLSTADFRLFAKPWLVCVTGKEERQERVRAGFGFGFGLSFHFGVVRSLPCLCKKTDTVLEGEKGLGEKIRCSGECPHGTRDPDSGTRKSPKYRTQIGQR